MPIKNNEKRKEYARVWIKKRREDYFNGKVCTDCGSIKNLLIHHLDPNTKESHRIWSWSEERRNRELSKCIVLCGSCHQKRHRPVTHGSRIMFQNYGCRCELCKEGYRKYWREYRAKKRLESKSS